MLAILMMAPTKRWKMPRLATLALGSGAVATLVKMFVLRPRPNSLKLDLATNEHAWIWSFDWTLSRIAEYDAGMRAFPSGYLATATALTVGLGSSFPEVGRCFWLSVSGRCCNGCTADRTSSATCSGLPLLGWAGVTSATTPS